MSDCIKSQAIKPLTPKSAMWQKMPLHAQYWSNFYQI